MTIITFGTAGAVVHSGITFGVGSRDRDIVTVVPYQNIVTFRTVPER